MAPPAPRAGVSSGRRSWFSGACFFLLVALSAVCGVLSYRLRPIDPSPHPSSARRASIGAAVGSRDVNAESSVNIGGLQSVTGAAIDEPVCPTSSRSNEVQTIDLRLTWPATDSHEPIRWVVVVIGAARFHNLDVVRIVAEYSSIEVKALEGGYFPVSPRTEKPQFIAGVVRSFDNSSMDGPNVRLVRLQGRACDLAVSRTDRRLRPICQVFRTCYLPTHRPLTSSRKR